MCWNPLPKLVTLLKSTRKLWLKQNDGFYANNQRMDVSQLLDPSIIKLWRYIFFCCCMYAQSRYNYITIQQDKDRRISWQPCCHLQLTTNESHYLLTSLRVCYELLQTVFLFVQGGVKSPVTLTGYVVLSLLEAGMPPKVSCHSELILFRKQTASLSVYYF